MSSSETIPTGSSSVIGGLIVSIGEVMISSSFDGAAEEHPQPSVANRGGRRPMARHLIDDETPDVGALDQGSQAA
jgi:hypothetical protein